MLSNIIGGIFIFLGVLFLLYPEWFRKSLRKKALRRIRRYFFAAMLFFGVMLFSAGWRHSGILPKILMVAGLLAVLKGLLLLKSKATDEVTAWILERPVPHLRLIAVGQIVLGFLVVFGLTK